MHVKSTCRENEQSMAAEKPVAAEQEKLPPKNNDNLTKLELIIILLLQNGAKLSRLLK